VVVVGYANLQQPKARSSRSLGFYFFINTVYFEGGDDIIETDSTNSNNNNEDKIYKFTISKGLLKKDFILF
jgi:hypothetical protein